MVKWIGVLAGISGSALQWVAKHRGQTNMPGGHTYEYTCPENISIKACKKC